ncbi:hypothetical protein FS764_24950 [Agrobacterium vitis]|uniref:hypothetical protein n=1 Tax=Agrobacterium vitis TaxID=373 RepID=UPI001F39366E|nr:hypothetical protein [Agrobacterium vitis]MCF1470114.1 hypothetical protein [Agrobacterium vitis]
MTAWTLDELRRLDLKYAEEGIHVHQRPFRAAMELLGSNFVMGVGGNPDVKRIMDAYAAMMPEVTTSWPGAGIGFAASVDQVRKLTFPVVFGERSLQPWELSGFSSAEEWWNWCRQDRTIAGEMALAVADLHDLTMGQNEVEQGAPAAITLWRMARSNIEDVANTLPTTFSHDSVIQPICMVAELSLKAALVWDGVDPQSFRKGKDGHNLPLLALRVADTRPHRDDVRVQAVVAALPLYVESRYKPAGLKRLEVVKLALGVQFIAASSLRRIASADLALQMENDDWPGPRQTFVL